MPLLIRVHEGSHRPVIVCDHCRREIESAADGNMMWEWDVGGESPVLFTHKACCYAFEQSRPNILLSSDLDVSFLRLGVNLAMTEDAWKVALHKAAMLGLFT